MNILSQQAVIPDWIREFSLENYLENDSNLQESLYSIDLRKTNQQILAPKEPGIYFIFGSYYTPENKSISLDMLTPDYEKALMKHLGLSTFKDLLQSGILRTGLINYPQEIEKDRGLLYVGSSSDFSKRLKTNHLTIGAIKKNALAIPYPYATDLRCQIKLLKVNPLVNPKFTFAIERELINRMKPPLNDQGKKVDTSDPFTFSDQLKARKPLQMVPSELTLDYLKEVLAGASKSIKRRVAASCGFEV